MSNYLIELSVIHMALVLGYWLFLRKERQYASMRFYLLASTLLSVTIPLLKLPKLFFADNEPVDAGPVEAIALDAATITPAADTSIWSYELLIWIYAPVSAFFLFKFLFGVVYLISLERKSSHARFNDVSIRKVRNIQGSFTFFNWIFLGDEMDANHHHYEVILKHEKAHASLGHSYDIMFLELFKVCFWWLPTSWFIIREIRKLHEYEADAYALKSCDADRYASILISSTLKTNGLGRQADPHAAKGPSLRPAGLASSFHEGLVLKRLIAMKQEAKKVSPWKLAFLSALCALLFIAFACSEERTDDSLSDRQTQGQIFTVVEKQPEFEGGPDAFYGYMKNEITYPLAARQKGVEGRVDVQFVVGKDGSISDVRVIKGLDADLDREAVRVVRNAPSFKPGMQNGKPVFVRMAIPIIFKLDDKNNSGYGIVIFENIQAINQKLEVAAGYANGEWSGTVYDEEGNGLPGANIVVGGTTTGTVSDLDGTFKVKAKESDDLFVSFVGYESAKLGGK